MAVETRLSPPIINGILPAFINDSEVLLVPFVLSAAVGNKQFKQVRILIKPISSNAGTTYTTSDYYYDYIKQCYIARFTIDKNKFKAGLYYKVQLACLPPAGTPEGYYSTVSTIKCTSLPDVSIKDREDGNKTNIYTYTGLYSQSGGDTTEKVYSYRFDLYDSANNLITTSGELLHNNSNDTEIDSSTDTWTIRQALKPNLSYFIQYSVKTINGIERSSPLYEIIEVQYEDPTIHANLSAINNFEEGYIRLALAGKEDNSYVTGSFILLRSSSEDGFDTWYELTRFQLNRWDSNNTNYLLCDDHTVMQGVTYRYAIQAYNAVGTYSNRLTNIEGNVYCDFEDAFLWDGKRQLKIRFNTKVGSFKSTVLESKTDTIGGKYPFIFRNGNVEYKEFPISGLLSMLSDNEENFVKWKDDPKDNLYDSKYFGLTADNYQRERVFKLEVLSWLTNGKPKLFRSAAEGNYIVRLMNVSLTPNDTLGRLLHTFNSTAYEIADCSFDNLQKWGFTIPSYVETRTAQFNQWVNLEDKAVAKSLDLSQAQMLRISDAPLTKFTYSLVDGTSGSAEVASNGFYDFPVEVLKTNPMVSISGNNWPTGATIEWMYYDTALESFSYIYKITPTDRIIQLLGTTGINFIEQLEDIRTKTGAFHYLKIAPRETKRVILRDGEYYLNHTDTQAVTFEPLYIYLEIDDNGTVTHYLDGRYGKDSRKPLEELSYEVKLSGSTAVHMDIAGTPLTAAAYHALTDIESLSELYLGDGVIADIVYQENILLYTVEAENSPYKKQNVIDAKVDWQIALNIYETTLSQSPDSTMLPELKAIADNKYIIYITTLKQELNKLKEEYNVDFAI